MARPQKFRHSREALTDPQIAAKLGGFVLDIEALRTTRKQIDDQIAAAFDAVDDAGFEKKYVRKVVSLRAKETDARRDEEEGLEAYEFAIEKGVSLASARSKPVSSQSYAEAKGVERTELEDTVAALREVTRQNGTNFDGYDAETRTFPAERELTDTQEQPGEPATQSEKAASAVISPNEYAGTSSDENPAPHSNPQPAASLGADKAGDVPPPPSPAALSDADVPAFLKPEQRKTVADYRPECKHPDACWSSNPLDHCCTCRRAMEAASETEAA